MISTGKMVEVGKLITRMGKEIRMLIRSAVELSYYSRGAWTYHDVLRMSQSEREIVADFVNERLQIAAKSSHPVF